MATVFAAVGSAVASAAPSVASFFGIGGGAAAGAAGAGSGVVTLSKVMSAGSALAAIGQGVAARRQAGVEAAFANAQAAQEEAQGAAQARDLAREYRDLAAEQSVVQLANGLDIGVGTPVSISRSTTQLAERNLDVTRATGRNRAAMSRLRGRGLLAEGRSAMLAGFGNAAKIGADAYQLTG